jgi:small conductance mechanosensitive channel
MEEANNIAAGFDWNQILDFMKTQGGDLAINVAIAIAIFYVGKLVVGLIVRGMRKVMRRQEVDQTLETFVCNLVRIILMAVVIIAAIGQIGIQTTSFIAIFGAAGLAVGLALQGSLSNFAAGVLIVLFRPYKVGDFVEAAGIAGVVEQVQILTTILKTGDNKQIIVPNGQIMDSIITNYSANDKRRVDMVVGVSYDDDLDKVRSTIEELVAADERILAEPACTIAVSALADSSVNFVVRPWVNTADYWGVLLPVPATGRSPVQGRVGLAAAELRHAGEKFPVLVHPGPDNSHLHVYKTTELTGVHYGRYFWPGRLRVLDVCWRGRRGRNLGRGAQTRRRTRNAAAHDRERQGTRQGNARQTDRQPEEAGTRPQGRRAYRHLCRTGPGADGLDDQLSSREGAHPASRRSRPGPVRRNRSAGSVELPRARQRKRLPG